MKKLTVNQEAFKKEIRRIRDGLRKAEKRGYVVDWSLVPELPNRVTKKRLEEIKKIKPRNIYIKGRWVDFETGEIISAHEHIYNPKPPKASTIPQTGGRPQNPEPDTPVEPQQIHEPDKPVETQQTGGRPQNPEPTPIPIDDILDWEDMSDVIISNFQQEINELSPSMQKYFNDWFNLLLNVYDKEELAEVIESQALTIREFIDNSIYPSWQAAAEYQEAFMSKLNEQLTEQDRFWAEYKMEREMEMQWL